MAASVPLRPWNPQPVLLILLTLAHTELVEVAGFSSLSSRMHPQSLIPDPSIRFSLQLLQQSTSEWTESRRGAFSPDEGRTENREPLESERVLAAIEPGSVLQIQIGDVSLARKAWKKRRRNKSPLLVPCSLLTRDFQESLEGNIVYLLKKFGSPRLSLVELSSRYRSHFRSSRKLINLLRNAVTFSTKDKSAKSEDDSEDDLLARMLLCLFPEENPHGVELRKNDLSGHWFIRIQGISNAKARKQAESAAVVQFHQLEKYPSSLKVSTSLEHTGMVRTKEKEGGYTLQPLSAALRVPIHQNGELLSMLGSSSDAVVPAYAWDFDVQGDAGSPILILSLSPPSQSRSGAVGNKTISPHVHTGKAPLA